MNKILSCRELVLWFFQGLWHSVAAFFGWLIFWTNQTSSGSLTLNNSSLEQLGEASFGLIIFTTVVIVVNLRLLFQSRSWNVVLIVSVIGSMIVQILLTLAYHSVRFGDTKLADADEDNSFMVMFHVL